MSALKQQIDDQQKLVARPQGEKGDLKARAQRLMQRYPKIMARLAQ